MGRMIVTDTDGGSLRSGSLSSFGTTDVPFETPSSVIAVFGAVVTGGACYWSDTRRYRPSRLP